MSATDMGVPPLFANIGLFVHPIIIYVTAQWDAVAVAESHRCSSDDAKRRMRPDAPNLVSQNGPICIAQLCSVILVGGPSLVCTEYILYDPSSASCASSASLPVCRVRVDELGKETRGYSTVQTQAYDSLDSLG